MSQRVAILQQQQGPVDFELLREALRGVPGLTPYDASSICSDVGGILCRNFSTEQATVMQGNLRAKGIEVEIVEESQLPALPDSKIIHRLEVRSDALYVEDLVRGLVPVDWGRVYLLAAGSVRLTNIVRQEKVTEVRRYSAGALLVGGLPIPHTEVRVDYSSKESTDWFLRLEILAEGSPQRYCIEAERFHFPPPAEGQTKDLSASFCVLARELAAHAPEARLSQGISSILADPPEFAYYPRKAAFLDEITWMLWKRQHEREGPSSR